MNQIIYIVFLSFFHKLISEECNNWDNRYVCQTEGIYEISESWDERAFQTPPKSDIYNRYKSTYQDMHYLVGYAQLKYSSDKKICTVKFITKVNPKLGTKGVDYNIRYKFGDIEQEEDTIILNSNDNKYPEGMPISAIIIDNRSGIDLIKLELEDEYFIWDNPIIEQSQEYENGQKGAIVEFFGWPYEDIAEECEFLSHSGYMGLKIYSPNEHLINYKNIEDEMLNPWWCIRQPVSYKLNSRMGDKKQLKNMINKCRSYNLRIYADIVINHMTREGYDMYDDHRSGEENNCFHWNEKGSTAGSPFWTTGFRYENNPYTGLEPGIEYPAVPYFPSDFHCKNSINDWNDLTKLNSGWLEDGTYTDLNTEKEYVQQRISDFFMELLSIGFSGISLQDAKHIFPESFGSIFQKLKESLGGEFPEDFIAVLQLNFGYQKEILICQDQEDKQNFADTFFLAMLKEKNLTDDDILKIKIWNTGFPMEMPKCLDDRWRISPERYTVSIENPNFININDPNNNNFNYIRDRNIETHRELTVNMFSNAEYNWKIKSVFSMYSIINGATGFPDGKSDCAKCKEEVCRKYCKKSVPYQNAYDPLSTGYDTGNTNTWKEGMYTRVHRDREIINAMRSWMNLNIMSDDELYYKERLKASCDIKCLACNEQSKAENLCLICNKAKGFFPLIYPGVNQKYYECLNSSMKFERIYFNEDEEAFKPCYESCKECDREGNAENHNCISCDVDLIERPGTTSILKNCVTNCTYSYYITLSGQYRCTEIPYCPIEVNKYIKDKNKCILNCEKDQEYKYLYNGICLKECPNNTFNNTFICVENDFNKCTLSEKEVQLNNFQESGGINAIVKSYLDEFNYTTKHVSKIKSKNYNIIIYRDNECINELSIQIPKIDFGACYEKAQSSINYDNNLIIVYAEKNNEINPTSSYSLYDPITGSKINGDSLCEKDRIIIEEKLYTFFNNRQPNYESMQNLIDQGINIFNISGEFFTDICYHFDSPKKRDITLKDRVLSFYPNITFCDLGCTFKEINLTTMTCICICKFNDLINNDLIQKYDIISDYVNSTIDIIYNSNIEVFLCFKDIFKYFKKSTGGIIIIASIGICISFIILYYFKDFKDINIYIQTLTYDYINLLSNNESFNKNKISKEKFNSQVDIRIGNEKYKNIKENMNKSSSYHDLNRLNKDKKFKIKEDLNNKSNEEQSSNNNIFIFKKKLSIKEKDTQTKQNKIKSNKFKVNDVSINKKAFFDDYLSTSLDDLDYEDAVKNDKRSFCKYIGESIISNQMLVSIFFNTEPLRPISIKIIFFNLTLDLFFTVNGLFYSESYISEIYHSENEKFFSFFPRSINRFFYTAIVNLIINLFIDCFFIEEKKIKGIFNREKDNFGNLKIEIRKLILKIKKRYLCFFIMNFCLLILFFIYLECFNYVYPYTQYDSFLLKFSKIASNSFSFCLILYLYSCMLTFTLSICSFIKLGSVISFTFVLE